MIYRIRVLNQDVRSTQREQVLTAKIAELVTLFLIQMLGYSLVIVALSAMELLLPAPMLVRTRACKN